MKKLLCLVMAIAICLALCVPAMAEDKPVTQKIIASQLVKSSMAGAIKG